MWSHYRFKPGIDKRGARNGMGKSADLVGDLYDAARGETDWASVLSAVADACGMENTALVHVDLALGYSDVIAPRADPGVISAYNADWWQCDPTVAGTAGAPVGRHTTLRDSGRARFLASPFYNDFWRHSGLGAERIAVNLVRTDHTFVSCVLQASPHRDEIEQAAQRRFAALTPHLIRAVTIQRSLQRLMLANALLGRSGGQAEGAVFVVNADCALQSAGEGADTFLEAEFLGGGQAIRLKSGRLELVDGQADLLFKQAVASVTRSRIAGAPISACDTDGGFAAIVEVLPDTPALASFYGTGNRPVAIVVVRRQGVRRQGGRRRVAERDGDLRTEPSVAVSALAKTKTVGERVGDTNEAGGRHGVLDAIKADIREHAAEPALTLAWLAKRNGVSARKIRDLFYAENTNFTEYLMTIRLERAREMLTDPEFRTANVAMIAAQSGFGDLSWFHHVFRRRYGVTPAQMRAAGGKAD